MGEWSDPVYVFSQIMALCGCVCYVSSYLQKKRVFILILCGLSGIFLTISYISLGGIIAATSEMIVLPRNIALYFIDRKRTNENRKKVLKADWVVLAVSTAAVIISAALTWNSVWCVFILVSGILYNIAICQKNIGWYCNLCLCGIACYIVYDFYLGSAVSSVFNVAILIGNIVGIANYYKRRRVPRLVNPQGVWYNE
jgi:hypothetical protein